MTVILGMFCLYGMGFCQEIRLMTYNIRYDNPNDGANRWELRRRYLVSQLKFYEPDILGIQEGLFHQVEYVKESLIGFEYVGVGRNDGEKKGEFTAVFYNSKKFKVIGQDTFWLSETPNVASVGWDAALERICTYALFEHKTSKKRLWVLNTHFDHLGKEAQRESAKLILMKIDAINKVGDPLVVIGDLNSEPGSEPIRILSDKLRDSKSASVGVVFGPNGTFNGFEFNKPVTRRIDYIFVSKNGITVSKYAVLSDSKNRRYPSDHLPVLAEISIKNR